MSPDSQRAGGGRQRGGHGEFSHHRVPGRFLRPSHPAKRNLAFMLPGFRFLFGAVMFLMSILVFGFGAAALLRTAHEEFATAPAWRPAPETHFAQAPETTPATLALLRVDDVPKEIVKDSTGD